MHAARSIRLSIFPEKATDSFKTLKFLAYWSPLEGATYIAFKSCLLLQKRQLSRNRALVRATREKR
jgi:hypothetical protein